MTSSCASARMLACAALLLGLLASGTSAQKTLSDKVEGAMLTFFGGQPDGMDPNSPSYGTKDGSCGYGTLTKDAYPFFATAAFSPSNPFFKAGPLNACGQCFRITCTDSRGGVCKLDSSGNPQHVDVMISDKCPECGEQHLDVQALSFAKIAQPAIGRIEISYQRIECTPPTDLKVAVMDFRGSGQWLRLSIDDTGGRGSVKSVQVKSSSGSEWKEMTNSWGATWEDSAAPSAPLDFKIQCDDGEAVIATGVVKQNGGINVGAFGQKLKFSTGLQFTFDGSSGDGTSSGSSAGSERVSAFSGPADGSSNSSSDGGSSAPSSSCVDVPAPGSFSCAQQKEWGKCDESSFKDNNYCALTCGRCESSSGTPSPSSSPVPPPSDSPSSCGDNPAPGGYSCQQQKDWGKCDDQFIVKGKYCAATCGRCSSGSDDSQPSVQSFSGPPGSGRRMLASTR